MKPSLLNPEFKYTNAAETDIRLSESGVAVRFALHTCHREVARLATRRAGKRR